jgi:DNA-binding transcriptional ArsR family regulator
MRISADGLAATRFAVSPLHETVTAVWLLGKPDPHPVGLPWLRWARGELTRHPLAAGRLWPLLTSNKLSWPEWLTPAPAMRAPSLAQELDRMLATPQRRVRESLERVFRGIDPCPEVVAELLATPLRTLELIAAEIAEAHDRLLAPYWDRVRVILDADIAYRSGVLASHGAGVLFAGLHRDLRWSDGELAFAAGNNKQAMLGQDGALVLTPTVLGWPDLSVKLHTSSQTALRYPARAAATVWELPDPGNGAVAELIGKPRARLLGLLRSPATPTVLARLVGVSPAAISQHLAVLRRTGLVDRSRSGRAVLYQTSDLGLGLLGAAPTVGTHVMSECGRPNDAQSTPLASVLRKQPPSR